MVSWYADEIKEGFYGEPTDAEQSVGPGNPGAGEKRKNQCGTTGQHPTFVHLLANWPCDCGIRAAKPAPGRIRQADIEGVGKGADAGIGKRILAVKSPKYEGLLSGV